MKNRSASAVLVLAATAVLSPSARAAFVASRWIRATTTTRIAPSATTTSLGSATGGWGIGQSRDLTDAEMSRGSGTAFDGYALRERGEFLQQIKQERASMKQNELDELLGVAQMAGIQVKDPTERLNKFESDVVDEEDDDLDVSVQWDVESMEDVDGESITRMDDDTGAPGAW